MLLAVVLAPACDSGERAPPNVVVIVASALRADAVGCYGGTDATPAIDGLAREGVRFEASYATAPWLAPSVASMLTGRAPSAHGFANVDDELAPDCTTLAQVLGAHGYATHAVVSDFLLGPARGIARGFASCEQIGSSQLATSDLVAAASNKFLARSRDSKRPFFLLAHFADAAPPLLRHAEDRGAPASAGELDQGASLDYLRVSSADLSAAERELLHQLRLGEVREVDRGVASILASLRKLDLTRRTLVIVVGSHGFEWLDRGWIGDGHGLHEELVRVPWVARLPGVLEAGRVVAEPVSTAALAATVLEYAGVDPLELGAWARTLGPRIRGDAAQTAQLVTFEVDYEPSASGVRERIAHMRGLRWGGLKLVRDARTGTLQLFDLRADPGELRDVASALPTQARELARYLDPPRVASVLPRTP